MRSVWPTGPRSSARFSRMASRPASTIRCPCTCSRRGRIWATRRATSPRRSAPRTRCSRYRCSPSCRKRRSKWSPRRSARRPTLSETGVRIVSAVHGAGTAPRDPAFVDPMADWLKAEYSYERLVDLYTRFMHGDDSVNAAMRATVFKAAARRAGAGLRVGSGVGFKHLDTFEIGDGVFIGAQTYLQGRFDGFCAIGARTWIGPQSYFDARNLVIEEHVGWGPGARVLGSTHTSEPIDVPIIQTDLEIKPVRIE